MKIVRLTTFIVPPRWLFLKIETDEGISGWGEPIVEGRPPRPLALDLALGVAAGLLLGLCNTVFDMMLLGRDLHEVPLANYLVLWPAIGGGGQVGVQASGEDVLRPHVVMGGHDEMR